MPNPVVFSRPGLDLTDSRNARKLFDEIEKIAIAANGLQSEPQQAASVQTTVPAQPATNVTNNIANPFKQAWYRIRTLINGNVQQVYVNPPLTLQQFGQYGVLLGDIGENMVAASFGGWTSLNEVMPVGLWGSSNQKLRLEARFAYNNSARGTFFRVSPNPNNTAASDFVIEANSNGSSLDTTKWCLKMKNLNVVTMPAPPKNVILTIVLEFDGTNAGLGKAQWRVGIDFGNGIVQQTLTDVSANNVGTIPQAFRLTWGSDYSDPTFPVSAAGSFPANQFDGVIAERRVFINTSGSLFSEPSYSSLVGWWNPSDMVQATYTDTGIIQMTQSSGSQPLTGSANIYIVTGNSAVFLYPSTVQDTGGLKGITIPLTVPTHGFPGSLAISTTPLTATIPTYNVWYAVITPNVARIKNKAFPDEDRYDLFHIPVANANPLVYPATPVSPLHTLKGVASPELFISANG